MTRAADAGRVLGLARRPARRAAMELVGEALITPDAGLEGDCKGRLYPRRQITLLAREDWEAAIAELADLAGPVPLSWTVRRANILTEGLALPRGKGSVVAIGEARLEVTGQTFPCARMDEAHPGLLKALGRDWRGGVTCRVLAAGRISIGAPARTLHHVPERIVRLPG